MPAILIIMQICLLVAWYAAVPTLPAWLVFLPILWLVGGALFARWGYKRLTR